MLSRIFAAFLLAVSLFGASAREAAPQGATPAEPYLVVIVMDGFRADYLNLAPMHHLRALMQRGRSYDTAWVGQMESETPPGHATIATGVYPRKHGVIGFGWRDPSQGGFTYMPTNRSQLAAGDLTRVVEGGGVPTISDLIHSRSRSDRTISVSGEKLWASAPLGVGADYVMYGTEVTSKKAKNKFHAFALPPNIPPAKSGYSSVTEPDSAFDTQDDFAARVAIKLVDSLRPRALLLNLPATDIAGHYYGGLTDPTDMRGIVRKADAAIGKIVHEYQRLGLFDKTVFVVTADHGMVTGRHRMPIHAVYDTVAKAPVQQLDQELRNSGGYIWLKDPEHTAMLASILARKRFPGVDGILYKAPAESGGMRFVPEASTAKALPAGVLQAYLDLADTEASPSGPEILMAYAENTTGMPLGKRFVGMHGGFSWGSQHIPLVIAGPGVRPGRSQFPAKLVDVAPTVERLLGLQPPSGVDGVVLADAVRSATDGERSAQHAVQSRRAADVRALEQHSAAQSR